MPAGSVVTVPVLLDLGLAELPARVWSAMHESPGVGVEELAALLAMPESQVRVGLDELADLALVRVSRRDAGRLVPIAAEAGLRVLLQVQETALEAQRRAMEQGRDTISRVLADGLTPGLDDPARRIEHLTDADAIQSRFEQLAYTATTSVETLMPVPAIPVDALDEARPLDAALLNRGVRMRMLYLEAIRNNAPTIRYARDMAVLGAEVRTAPLLPARLFLADRRIALVPLDPGVGGHGVACVSSPGVIASLAEFFDAIWRSAAPLDVGNPVDPGTGLTDTERELLQFLAGGGTDEAVAKRLGVSLRTVRKIMAELMTRLDASSRFEAGIKAAKQGWL